MKQLEQSEPAAVREAVYYPNGALPPPFPATQRPTRPHQVLHPPPPPTSWTVSSSSSSPASDYRCDACRVARSAIAVHIWTSRKIWLGGVRPPHQGCDVRPQEELSCNQIRRHAGARVHLQHLGEAELRLRRLLGLHEIYCGPPHAHPALHTNKQW